MLLILKFPSKKQKLQLLAGYPPFLPPYIPTSSILLLDKFSFLIIMVLSPAKSAFSSNLMVFKVLKWQILPKWKRKSSDRNESTVVLPPAFSRWDSLASVQKGKLKYKQPMKYTWWFKILSPAHTHLPPLTNTFWNPRNDYNVHLSSWLTDSRSTSCLIKILNIFKEPFAHMPELELEKQVI